MATNNQSESAQNSAADQQDSDAASKPPAAVPAAFLIKGNGSKNDAPKTTP